MNGFLKKLMEFADFCGVIDSFNAYDAEWSSVEGKTRDGKKFSISVRITEIEEVKEDA